MLGFIFGYLKKKFFRETSGRNGSREIVGITQNALDMAMEASKDSYPDEFIGVLQAEPAQKVGVEQDGIVITELALIPGSFSNEVSATLQSHNIPTSRDYVGTVHSHPSGATRPSDQDRSMFQKGRIHLILGHPYEGDNWKAYRPNGEQRRLPVVEAEKYYEEEFSLPGFDE